MSLHNDNDYRFDIYNVSHLQHISPSEKPWVNHATNLSDGATLRTLPDKNNYTKEMNSFYRLRPSKVNEFKYKFIINGENICAEDTYMITLVHSWHKYGDRRKAIRETWGSTASGNGWPQANVTSRLRLAFVFGKHPQNNLNILIGKENEQHADIIQGDFIEDYKNMTLKSLLGLRWVSMYCPQAKFILKSDDDMMVNVPALIDSLTQVDLKRTIIGPYCPHSKVLRRGKWGLTKEQFPFNFYPPYFAGSSYVITTDLAGM